jgi:hypothetical protein
VEPVINTGSNLRTELERLEELHQLYKLIIFKNWNLLKLKIFRYRNVEPVINTGSNLRTELYRLEELHQFYIFIIIKF